MLGVVDGLDCSDPQIGDADEQPNTDRHTPHTLGEALQAIEADTVLTEAMGADLVRTYLELRRYDLARWEKSGTEWDRGDDQLLGAGDLPPLLLTPPPPRRARRPSDRRPGRIRYAVGERAVRNFRR